MEKLKVHIQHVMLLEFENNKNATETFKRICSFYDLAVFTNYRTGCLSFVLTIRHGEMNPDQDTF